MIDERKIAKLSGDFIGEGNLFLVEVKVTSRNQIRVSLDGDEGVAILDCIRLSRYLESELDRDREDFELEVSSVGVGTPLRLLRQYRNNLGRRLAVVFTSDGEETTIKGKLMEVGKDGFTLAPDKKEKGKKKRKNPESDLEAAVFIPLDKVRETKVLVAF